MYNAPVPSPSAVLSSARHADRKKKGIIIFNTSNAAWLKGSKIGIKRYTASSENAEIEAMFPVLKKPDCSRYRKKSAVRKLVGVSADAFAIEFEYPAAFAWEVPFIPEWALPLDCKGADFEEAIDCWVKVLRRYSSRTQLTTVAENAR